MPMTRSQWDNAPDRMKLAYLYEWCEILEQNLRTVGSQIQHLHERLKRVEAGAGGNQ